MREGSDCPAFVIPNYDAGTRVGHQGDTRNDSDCLTSKKTKSGAKVPQAGKQY